MAQVKLLKIAADGIPREFDSTADDITLNSYTAGAGPVMSPTGIDMNGQDVTDLSDLVFTDPAVGTINQTAGALIVNNIMAKERDNLMTTSGAILFPTVTDTGAQVDAFRLPTMAGVPTATPTFGGEGYVIWDSTGNRMYVWDGAAWDDQSTVTAANWTQDNFIADEALAIRDVVYISAADNVSKAIGSDDTFSNAIGLAQTAAADTATVPVQFNGLMGGFTGLTAGATYFLSAATAGLITSSIPTGTGNTIVQIGFAKSTTVLLIQIQQLGRRA